MGYVYLLLQIDKDGLETHKIGVTRRKVETRVKELQTGNPNPISILRTYQTENYFKVEGMLHRKYSMLTTEAKNEWRELPPEAIFSFINDCEEVDNTIKFLQENNHFYD